MVKRFRVLTIALLGANNVMKKHNEIVTKEDLTGSVDDLLEEGFIEEVKETASEKKAREQSEKDAADALLNEARTRYKELFGKEAGKKLTVEEIEAEISEKETEDANALEVLNNARSEYKEVFGEDADESLSIEQLQSAISEKETEDPAGFEGNGNLQKNELVLRLKNK